MMRCLVCNEGWELLEGDSHCLFCGASAAAIHVESPEVRGSQGIVAGLAEGQKPQLLFYEDDLPAAGTVALCATVTNRGTVDLTTDGARLEIKAGE